MILNGNAESEFRDVSFKEDGEDLRSIARFGDKMILSSDYALHSFDGHICRRSNRRLIHPLTRSYSTHSRYRQLATRFTTSTGSTAFRHMTEPSVIPSRFQPVYSSDNTACYDTAIRSPPDSTQPFTLDDLRNQKTCLPC